MELARGGRPAGRQSGAVYAVTATQTGNLSLDLPLSVCVHITAGRSVTPTPPSVPRYIHLHMRTAASSMYVHREI